MDAILEAEHDDALSAYRPLALEVLDVSRQLLKAEGFFVAANETGFQASSPTHERLQTTNSLLVRDPTSGLWLEWTTRLATRRAFPFIAHQASVVVRPMDTPASPAQACAAVCPQERLGLESFVASLAREREDFLAALPGLVQACNQHCAP